MWNVIECIFSVLKQCFHILLIAPEYDLEVQTWIPAALCAIHNFIQEHDLDEGGMEEERDVFDEGSENESEPIIPEPEGEIATSLLQNQIAQDMWDQYQELLTRRRLPVEDSDFFEEAEADMYIDEWKDTNIFHVQQTTAIIKEIQHTKKISPLEYSTNPAFLHLMISKWNVSIGSNNVLCKIRNQCNLFINCQIIVILLHQCHHMTLRGSGRVFSKMAHHGSLKNISKLIDGTLHTNNSTGRCSLSSRGNNVLHRNSQVSQAPQLLLGWLLGSWDSSGNWGYVRGQEFCWDGQGYLVIFGYSRRVRLFDTGK